MRRPAGPAIGAVLIVLLCACGDASAASRETCASGSPHPAYTVQLCLLTPAPGATVTGTVPVMATVRLTGTAPPVNGITYTLDGKYLTFDAQAPYRFVLHTWLQAPGRHALGASVAFSGGDISPPLSADLVVAPSPRPPAPAPFRPAPGSEPAPGSPFTIAVTGDGASGLDAEQQVADLIGSWGPNLFLYLGDVYEHGTAEDFLNWYGDGGTFYSRFRPITDPAVGNHEFEADPNGGAYAAYWGMVPTYYSVDTHGWHIVVLDDVSPHVSLTATSPEYRWLEADLAAHPNPCTIVTVHRPRFNLDEEGPAADFEAFWRLIAAHRVPLMLGGHGHDYQRWQPMDAGGHVAAGGTTEFVVGTGGQWISPFVDHDARLAFGLDTTSTAWGALRLGLSAAGAHFAFVSSTGVTEDSGFVPCTSG